MSFPLSVAASDKALVQTAPKPLVHVLELDGKVAAFTQFVEVFTKVLENAPFGNGVLLCALLSFLVLLVSRSPTALVRFLCIAFPTCIRTGAQ